MAKAVRNKEDTSEFECDLCNGAKTQTPADVSGIPPFDRESHSNGKTDLVSPDITPASLDELKWCSSCLCVFRKLTHDAPRPVCANFGPIERSLRTEFKWMAMKVGSQDTRIEVLEDGVDDLEQHIYASQSSDAGRETLTNSGLTKLVCNETGCRHAQELQELRTENARLRSELEARKPDTPNDAGTDRSDPPLRLRMSLLLLTNAPQLRPMREDL